MARTPFEMPKIDEGGGAPAIERAEPTVRGSATSEPSGGWLTAWKPFGADLVAQGRFITRETE
jgi:hypothetical protein